MRGGPLAAGPGRAGPVTSRLVSIGPAPGRGDGRAGLPAPLAPLPAGPGHEAALSAAGGMKRDSTCMEGERGRGGAGPSPQPPRGCPAPAPGPGGAAPGLGFGFCGGAAAAKQPGRVFPCLSSRGGSALPALQPSAAHRVLQLKKKVFVCVVA